jgi:hypothetical protein
MVQGCYQLYLLLHSSGYNRQSAAHFVVSPKKVLVMRGVDCGDHQSRRNRSSHLSHCGRQLLWFMIMNLYEDGCEIKRTMITQ